MSSEQLAILLFDIIVDALFFYGVVWFARRHRWIGTVLCSLGVWYQGVAHGQEGSGAPSSSIGGIVWLVMFHVTMSVSVALIAKRLGRNPFLYGILFFIPVTTLAAIAMLAGSSTHDRIESPDSGSTTEVSNDR